MPFTKILLRRRIRSGIVSRDGTYGRQQRRYSIRSTIFLACCSVWLIIIVCTVLIIVLVTNFQNRNILLPSSLISLTPAIQRAKLYGLPQRKQNQGHTNKSTWRQLSTNECEEQASLEILELEEIQRLKLPQAILIGVQKGYVVF